MNTMKQYEYPKGALIDALFEMPQFECGSQIKESACMQEVLAALRQLSSTGAYTLEQWSYALTYIAGRDICLKTEDELASFLIKKRRQSCW